MRMYHTGRRSAKPSVRSNPARTLPSRIAQLEAPTLPLNAVTNPVGQEAQHGEHPELDDHGAT